MLKAFKFFSSFEFLFVCFLFAGQYKADPRFAFSPIDLTLFFFSISMCTGVILILRQFRFSIRSLFSLLIFFFFCVFVVLSMSWSQSVVYASEKSIKIFSLVAWSFLAPLLIIGPSPRRMERFKSALLLLAFWMAFEGLLLLLESGSRGFLHVMGSNYIGLGRILGIGVMVILAKLQIKEKNLKNYAVHFCLLLFFLFIMLAAGGRGALLALLLGWLLALLLNANLKYYFISLCMPKKTIIKIIVLAAVLMTVAVNFSKISTSFHTISRMRVLFSSEGFGSSGNARVKYWENAFALWRDKPFVGYGIGSWPLLNSADDHRSYPHNIILEIMVETGILGLTLFILLIYFVFKPTLKTALKIKKNESFFLQILLLVSLLNAMISGDIPDNRFLFTAIGLCGGWKTQKIEYTRTE